MSQGSGLLRRTVDRDGRADFVIAQRFEVGKLTIEQVGRHEVALSRSDPCGNQLTRAIEVQKEDVRRGGSQPVTVAPLQR